METVRAFEARKRAELEARRLDLVERELSMRNAGEALRADEIRQLMGMRAFDLEQAQAAAGTAAELRDLNVRSARFNLRQAWETAPQDALKRLAELSTAESLIRKYDSEAKRNEAEAAERQSQIDERQAFRDKYMNQDKATAFDALGDVQSILAEKEAQYGFPLSQHAGAVAQMVGSAINDGADPMQVFTGLDALIDRKVSGMAGPRLAPVGFVSPLDAPLQQAAAAASVAPHPQAFTPLEAARAQGRGGEGEAGIFGGIFSALSGLNQQGNLQREIAARSYIKAALRGPQRDKALRLASGIVGGARTEAELLRQPLSVLSQLQGSFQDAGL